MVAKPQAYRYNSDGHNV